MPTKVSTLLDQIDNGTLLLPLVKEDADGVHLYLVRETKARAT